MKRLFTISLALFLCLLPRRVEAQELQRVFQQAESAYDMGRFGQADSLLQSSVEKLKGEEQIRAYRMLALINLRDDRTEQAEEYVSRLLVLDPFYTAYGDSPRFADMVERLKKGKATITTASKIAESLEEVPVPVTLITEDMIRASGATKLSDVIRLYVPGISQISSIEDNLAIRGVNGLTQETMLVMIDGHRINSQSTNAGPLDFRNSLDKIKQIEVLRGPASSLYGNVALTAVINIITKPGSDLEGGRVSAMAGKNNSYGGSLLLGDGNLKADYMTWASLYNAQGEKRILSGTTHYINGYNQKPTFDFGGKIRWGDFNIHALMQHANVVPYYNLICIGETFSYDKYGRINGEHPGSSRANDRIDIDYNHSWGNFSLSASAFMAHERVQIYNVLGDTIPYKICAALASLVGVTTVRTSGVMQTVNWEDYSLGGSVSGSYAYRMKNQMSGSVMFGLQYENLMLTDGALKLGADYNKTNTMLNDILQKGDEFTFSSFIQLKHSFSKKLIFNGGLRFDNKYRFDDRRLNTMSPRVSLIWRPTQVFSMKGAFSHSFVDAPVFYRASTLTQVFSGGSALNPEKMDSYQIGLNFHWAPLHLKYELNTFYNNVSDMVYFASGNDVGGFTKFVNAGEIGMGGVENVLHFATDKTMANLNVTYQYPFNVETVSNLSHTLYNIPRFLFNLTAQQLCYQNKRAGKFWARANMHAQSSYKCKTTDIVMMMTDPTATTYYDQKGYAEFGAGVEWKSTFGLGASFDTYNLFNAHYDIGGQLYRGIPCQSFHFMGRLSMEF